MQQATETQKSLSDAVDTVLLEIIRNGRTTEETDHAGNVTVVKRQPAAADIMAAIKRLQQCGVAPAGAIDDKGPVGSIIAELRKKGMRFPGGMPPITEEEDEAIA